MSDAEYFKPAKEAVNGFINIQNTWASLTTERENANDSATPWESHPLAATGLCSRRVYPEMPMQFQDG